MNIHLESVSSCLWQGPTSSVKDIKFFISDLLKEIEKILNAINGQSVYLLIFNVAECDAKVVPF